MGREAFGRLEKLLKEAAPGDEYTFEHLVKEVQPPSPETLAYALSKLVKSGALKKVIRVQSRSNQGGIEDFPSLKDVPPEIYDDRTDRFMKVRREDLRVIYTLDAA